LKYLNELEIMIPRKEIEQFDKLIGNALEIADPSCELVYFFADSSGLYNHGLLS
jgi:hypothetical protein